MRVLDLFSGIGGFSLGLERAGMETIAFCEREPFCRKVLAKHWPGVPIYDDITTFDGTKYRGTADVVCGGFPCQPFSQAGKRRGKSDDRHLWPQMLRVIREVEPRFVIGENVVGLINMELDACLSDLEACGYACGAFVVPACAVDARHRRDRVWILADRNRESEPDRPVDAQARRRAQTHDANANGLGWYRTQINIFGEAEPVDGQERESGSVCEVLAGPRNASVGDSVHVAHANGYRASNGGEGRDIRHGLGQRAQAERERQIVEHGFDARGETLADSNDAGRGKQRRPEPAPPQLSAAERSGDVSDAGCGRSERPWREECGSASPARWIPEPAVGRVADGIPGRVDRLRALGNAAVPQVVEQIGRAIVELTSAQPANGVALNE